MVPTVKSETANTFESSAAPRSQNGAGYYAGRFSGRSAIVTGGASGLGLLTAARIVQEGGKVSLWDVNAAALNATSQKLGGAHTVQVNVGCYEDVIKAAVETVALGRF